MMLRRTLMFAPLSLAAAGGVGAYVLLSKARTGVYVPTAIPNPLLGHPMPDFATDGLTAADVRAMPGPKLLNFFASWCAPCVVEAPTLASLSQRKTPLLGIAYKDKPAATDGFLQRQSNPYGRLGRDIEGRTGIAFGITGVPETFLVDAAGTLRWRYAGPLTPSIVAAELDPALQAAA